MKAFEMHEQIMVIKLLNIPEGFQLAPPLGVMFLSLDLICL
jgi:hypothetical protein